MIFFTFYFSTTCLQTFITISTAKRAIYVWQIEKKEKEYRLITKLFCKMNFDHSIDISAKKSFIRPRANYLRDDASGISGTSAYESQQLSAIVNQKADLLFSHFLAVIQSSNNEMEVFETVFNLRQVLENTIEEMEMEGKKKFVSTNNWIRLEMNTWSLIYCLYKDRLVTQKEEMEQDDLPLVNSEKMIVEHLYASKSLL